MPKPYGYTTKGKIEAWLRKNSRTDNSYYGQYTLFTSAKLANILDVSEASVRRALSGLETTGQLKRYTRIKEGIIWENTVIRPNKPTKNK
jgi:predicted transcriptional regulator of viral defense system